MATRNTGLRIVGLALASLCLSTAARAQLVTPPGWTPGCLGDWCGPAAGIAAYRTVGLTPEWAARGTTKPALYEMFGNQNAQNNENDDAQGDEHGNAKGDEDEFGFVHLNGASTVSTGAAFALLLYVLKPAGSGHDRFTGNNSASSAGAPGTFSAPNTSHVELVQTSALVSTPVAATPEPTTQALMATGLIAIGAAALLRRRRQPSRRLEPSGESLVV